MGYDALGSNQACYILPCFEFRWAGIVSAGPPYHGRGRLRRKALARCSVVAESGVAFKRCCSACSGLRVLRPDPCTAPSTTLSLRCLAVAVGVGWAFLGATVAPVFGTALRGAFLMVSTAWVSVGAYVLCYAGVGSEACGHTLYPIWLTVSLPVRSTDSPLRLFLPCLTSLAVAGRIHLDGRTGSFGI